MSRERHRRRWSALGGGGVLLLVGLVGWLSPPGQDAWLFSRSTSELSALVRANPGLARARYHLAAALLREGSPRQALEVAGEGAGLAPRDVRLPWVAGAAAIEVGDLPRAAAYLQKARELGGPGPELLRSSAALALRQGNHPEALARLEQRTRAAKEDAEAWLLLARCRGELGMPRESLAAAKEAIRLRPRESRFWVELAEAYLRLDENGRAVFAAHRATTLDRRSRRAWLVTGRVLGRNARSPSEEADADLGFQQAVGAELPGELPPEAMAEYGRYLLQHQAPIGAIPYLEQARARAPRDPSLTFLLAHAYRRTGRGKEAGELFRLLQRQRCLPEGASAAPAGPSR
ncbi:MAG: tetratricopeptide repeat protein [Armatimonadetes bacterium]|nr:tetratricopeptide repeat protein [Armatimonadota bacterium]